MMLAEFDFYKNEYKGIAIADASTYGFYGERASDELALYSKLPVFTQNVEALTQLKKCACRIADILYSQNGASKGGRKVATEAISGYYSVTYADNTEEQVQKNIRTAVCLYIGRYIGLGAKKVVY